MTEKIERETIKTLQEYCENYNKKEAREVYWKIAFWIIFFSILSWLYFIINEAFLAVS